MHALKLTTFVLTCFSCLVACGSSDEEDPPASYLIHDPYGLPQPLVAEDGTEIRTEAAWFDKRRPETLALFAEHVYGKTPVDVPELSYEVFEEAPDALGGKAIRRQVRIALASDPTKWGMDLLLYLPVGATSSPVFLGLNFGGNHTVNADPAIRLTTTSRAARTTGGRIRSVSSKVGNTEASCIGSWDRADSKAKQCRRSNSPS